MKRGRWQHPTEDMEMRLGMIHYLVRDMALRTTAQILAQYGMEMDYMLHAKWMECELYRKAKTREEYLDFQTLEKRIIEIVN
jgi:hypothetical protein